MATRRCRSLSYSSRHSYLSGQQSSGNILLHRNPLFLCAKPTNSSSSLQFQHTTSFRPSQCPHLYSLSKSPSRFVSTKKARAMGSLPEHERQLEYPDVRRDNNVADDYHGIRIEDPYRWLEDPDDSEVKEFVKKQVQLTESVLSTCETRKKLEEKITSLFDHPKYGCPYKRGDKYYYSYNSGLQPQSVLYIKDSLESEGEVLLDPNQLSEDGTTALTLCEFSEDAQYLAAGLSISGSDWMTIKVLNVSTRSFEDCLSWVKFSSVAWTHDGKGFFYSRYPPPENKNTDAGTETDLNLCHQLYYHFLGTDQSEDILCWKNLEQPKWFISAEITEDGKYVVASISEGCDPVNRLYYCDLDMLEGGIEGLRKSNDMLPFQKLIDNFDAKYEVIANDGPIFTFYTNKGAPRYKLARVDIREADVWIDVIPESEKDVLESADCVNSNQLLVCYLRDVKYILQVRDLQKCSLIQDLPLDIGTISAISGRRKDQEVFFSFTSFLTPGIIYRCDLSNKIPEPKIYYETVVSGFDRSRFETIQVFVTSTDGTKIPMFIVAEKNCIFDQSHPTLLYGYGGFNVNITPYFNAAKVALLQHSGTVIATANIRGGGEYGEEWHKAGSLDKKQNCFDDFQACAEYLIREGYTQSKLLGIEGGSNGGLLVAACVNQRPELFGCALAHVGVMDMLRFHKFTIGHAWTTDYGCSDNEEQFHWMIKYSPLHNVSRPWERPNLKDRQYPATMLLTADHDDRVVPLHTMKLLATMQHILVKTSATPVQTNPIIGRIETKAGHGSGRPTKKTIEEAADRYSFLLKMIGAKWTD